MKGDFMKRIFKRMLSLTVWCILATAAALPVKFLLNACYVAAHSRFGEAFPLFNPITDKAAYFAFNSALQIIAYTVSLLIFVYFSVRTDNDRYEYIIEKTEGFYTVKEGYPLYTGRYLVSDIWASVLAGAILTVPVEFIPDRLFSLSLFSVLEAPKAVISLFPSPLGVAVGAVLLSTVILISHFPAIVFSLKVWRTGWLTAFSE